MKSVCGGAVRSRASPVAFQSPNGGSLGRARVIGTGADHARESGCVPNRFACRSPNLNTPSNGGRVEGQPWTRSLNLEPGHPVTNGNCSSGWLSLSRFSSRRSISMHLRF
jgi:hypothetical protein